ncbi:rhomboid family intramembrane serine protease [Romeria aff. gracilis LEGE 07310]|uniref:Rhomboid family intramembrane serine protease n=1 Tax=Vasconcelosia minhoensis LEGE 07310 TaxID=915328 RepID=A0A8J7DSC1_9CYAN|nr:rhomboid family intramembrane serine protease [Romeria gracilis]MBE9079999.1 rhomboid family intramembrane serine protease [Romeria aff. gracilis LEGE 07310]
MVPLRDENPIKITPYVTYGLIAVNVLVFLFEISLRDQTLTQLFYQWAVVPKELTISFQTGFGFPHWSEWGTLISAQFLHAGFLHIAGNMLYLWVFGNNVEDQLGHVKFLVFYLVCGILASLTQWFFDPASAVPSLGASGAIAGIMGAYIFRFPNVRILTFVPLGFFFTTFRIPALLFLGFWFVQQALYGFVSLGAPADVGMGGGVAYWAHAGGFVFGAALGWLLGLFNPEEGYQPEEAPEEAVE